VYKLENFNVHNIYILIKFMENCNQVWCLQIYTLYA
jgi:hypothetical protein